MDVKLIQSRLSSLGYPVQVDGITGPLTTHAIMKYQHDFNLKPDGMIGPETLDALFANAPKGRVPHSSHAEFAVKLALVQEGVREATGKNDGPEVENYLKSVGLPKGYSWCMAFVFWCFEQTSSSSRPNHLIRTGGCMKQWNETILQKTRVPIRGDIFIIDLGNGAGHTGLVTKVNDDGTVDTIEGNTNDNGSANGDGVYARTRKISRMKGFIRVA